MAGTTLKQALSKQPRARRAGPLVAMRFDRSSLATRMNERPLGRTCILSDQGNSRPGVFCVEPAQQWGNYM